MNLGDLVLGATTSFQFSTAVATVPTTLVGGTLAVYEGSNLTPITAGLTLTADFDGLVGNHNVTLVGTTGNGYAAGKNYTLYLLTGTVGGTTVTPCVLALFSIENRTAQTPAANAAGLLDATDAIEVGLTPRGALRLVSAGDAGVLAGALTNTVTIKNAVANTKTRITATVDADGNRTVVSTDLT